MPVDIVVAVMQRLCQFEGEDHGQGNDRPEGAIGLVKARDKEIESRSCRNNDERKREEIVALERRMSARDVHAERQRKPAAKMELGLLWSRPAAVEVDEQETGQSKESEQQRLR